MNEPQEPSPAGFTSVSCGVRNKMRGAYTESVCPFLLSCESLACDQTNNFWQPATPNEQNPKLERCTTKHLPRIVKICPSGPGKKQGPRKTSARCPGRPELPNPRWVHHFGKKTKRDATISGFPPTRHTELCLAETSSKQAHKKLHAVRQASGKAC